MIKLHSVIILALIFCGIFIIASIAKIIAEDNDDEKKKLIIKENKKILNENNIHSLNDIEKKLAREYLSNPENTIPLTLKMVKKMASKYDQKIKLEKQRGLLLNNDN